MARWTSRAGLSSNPRCSLPPPRSDANIYPKRVIRRLSNEKNAPSSATIFYFLSFFFIFFLFIFFSNALLRFDNLINGHVLLETRVCAKPTGGDIRTNPRTNERTNGDKESEKEPPSLLLSGQKVHESALGRIPKGKRRERVSRRSFEGRARFCLSIQTNGPFDD